MGKTFKGVNITVASRPNLGTEVSASSVASHVRTKVGKIGLKVIIVVEV